MILRSRRYGPPVWQDPSLQLRTAAEPAHPVLHGLATPCLTAHRHSPWAWTSIIGEERDFWPTNDRAQDELRGLHEFIKITGPCPHYLHAGSLCVRPRKETNPNKLGLDPALGGPNAS